LINELQIQDSGGSDEEVGDIPTSKTAMVCKLAQIPPEIWMTLSIDAKKWLLNERKLQQQEDDRRKRSLLDTNQDPVKAPDKKDNKDAIPNQYARVKNGLKGEEDVQNHADQNYTFIDEFLEVSVKNSNLYESDRETGYDFWTSEHNIHASISINNTLHNKCMNLLFLPERHHISISDGGADTCVLSKGWEIISTHNSRRANIVGFDHETAIKLNLPIVSAITAPDLPNGQSILLVIHESIDNETSNHSLLSEFQLREFGVIIDSKCHRHGGTQQIVIKDDNHSDPLVIPLDLAGCMVHFRHRLPTSEEIASLKQYNLTQGGTPWNPSSFSDQVADKFYQQVIEAENHNVMNEVTLPKMMFFDPSDLIETHLKGKPVHLIFHADTIKDGMINSIVPTNTDLHYSKALPSKIDYEKLSPYFAFRPHDVIQ
jgi:hypothetical protein